jgi:tetratricopeptide (TPR) repeat protein
MAFHPSNELGLSLGGAKLITAITLENFAKLASKAELSSRQIVEIAKAGSEAFLSVWTEHKDSLPFPARVREQLELHIATSELFRLDKLVSGFGISANRSVPFFLYAGLAGIAGDVTGNSPEAILFNLANKAYLESDYSTSLKLFDSSIETRPTALAYYNRGCSYAQLNQLGRALQDFVAAGTLGGLAEASYNSAIMEIRLSGEVVEKLPQIVAFLKAAVAARSGLAQAWYNLGVYHLIHQATKDSIESFKRAIEVDPMFAEAYFNLAIALYISGDKEGAALQFANAAAQNSNYAALQPKQNMTGEAQLMAVGAPRGPAGPRGNL